MRRPLAICVLASAGALLPSPANAEPPTEADFEVRYFLTDADGDTSRQLTLQDMQSLVNKARCECGQQIIARVTLTNTSGVDPLLTQSFVGTDCDVAQEFGFGQNLPCAQLHTGFPDNFATRLSFPFHPLWLGTGAALMSQQDISVAIPGGTCDAGQGSGGIWMCAENGMETNCQAGEFFMKGTANVNVPEGETPAGIAYDFTPPVVPTTLFEATPGDGAVVIKWSLDTPGDINGYRVLCADEGGSPLPGKGVSAPSLTAENNGTIYYTAQGLCPEGPFFDVNGNPTGDTGGTTGGGTTGGGTTAGGTTAGGDTSTSTSTGGADTSTSGGTGADTGAIDPEIDAMFEGLSYDYVCSKHLPATTNKVRVEGLDNGSPYYFIVVAYDQFGNPMVASDLLTAEPEATNDLWDTCQDDEFAGVCGERGFCNCSVSDDMSRDLALSVLGLGLFGLVRRRRRA